MGSQYKPTATTWVFRKPDGSMQRIRVVDMEDQHLWRWIRYFRRKWRESGFKGSDAVLDAIIKTQMVTAPAIYQEAKKRGVINLPDPPIPISPAQAVAAAAKLVQHKGPVEQQRSLELDAPPEPGSRLITLEDD